MAYPLKKVLETRVLASASFETLNEKLATLQAGNRNMNGSTWEPHGDLIVTPSELGPTFTIVMNRYEVKTY